MRIRRLRGVLLRLVFHRPMALCAGTCFLSAAVWISWGEYHWEDSLSDGLSMLMGATGVALILMAIGGRQSDWQE